MNRALRAAVLVALVVVFPMAASAGALFEVPTVETVTSPTTTTAPASGTLPIVDPTLVEDPLASVFAAVEPLVGSLPTAGLVPSAEPAPTDGGSPTSSDPVPAPDDETGAPAPTSPGDATDEAPSSGGSTAPSSTERRPTTVHKAPVAEPAPVVVATASSTPSAPARRDIQRVGLAPDGGPSRSAAAEPRRVRSTADLIAALRAIGAGPTTVAKTMAPFPVAGVATYDGRTGPGRTALVEAPEGGPVIAPEDGTVLAIGDDWITVGTGRGARFQFAGLARLQPLSVGDAVKRAEVLGFLGRNATLRFGLSTDAATFDPIPVLDRWLDRAAASVGVLRSSPAHVSSARPRLAAGPTSKLPRPDLAFVTAAARSASGASGNPAAWGPVLMAGLVAAWVLLQVSRTRARNH